MKNPALYRYAYIALTCLCFFLVCSMPQWLSTSKGQVTNKIPTAFIIIFVFSTMMIWIISTLFLLFQDFFENLLF